MDINNKEFKRRVGTIFVILLLSLFSFLLIKKLVINKDPVQQNKETVLTSSQPKQNGTKEDSPNVVSTNPFPLENALILPNQTIQITFSDSAVNTPELKFRMDPEDGRYQLKLSDDRKTLSIIPNPTFGLGIGYTMFIPVEAKFDNGKKLKEDIIYHFHTINYNGV